MLLINMFYQFVKDSFEAPSTSVMKNSNISQKELSLSENFYLHSFLLLTSTYLQDLWPRITRNRCRNRYTLNQKSYLHWRGIATYLYSQLTKLLIISRNMNYPRKNLICLTKKQVYAFQSNQIKLENPKSSLPLKRFIVRFLTTLNWGKQKVRFKPISSILLIRTFSTTNLLHVNYVSIVSYKILGRIKILS